MSAGGEFPHRDLGHSGLGYRKSWERRDEILGSATKSWRPLKAVRCIILIDPRLPNRPASCGIAMRFVPIVWALFELLCEGSSLSRIPGLWNLCSTVFWEH